MFPRLTCSRCRRSIAVNRNGAIRSHFCPHYKACDGGACRDCEASLEGTPFQDLRLPAGLPRHPHPPARLPQV
jgi:hypothetical protein